MTPGDFNKIANFAASELDNLQRAQKLSMIPIKQRNQNEYEVRDWCITVQAQDQIVCQRTNMDPLMFHNKTCAIIYVLNDLQNSTQNTLTIRDLDREIYHLRAMSELLKFKIQRARRSGTSDTLILLQNKYSEAAARLNGAIAKIKKYCYLTKYNKGIMI